MVKSSLSICVRVEKSSESLNMSRPAKEDAGGSSVYQRQVSDIPIERQLAAKSNAISDHAFTVNAPFVIGHSLLLQYTGGLVTGATAPHCA